MTSENKLQNPILEAIQVTKYLGKKQQIQVLNQVNLAVYPGELISIIGPSGSGKTTLLYLMGALDRPSAGEIRIENQSTSDLPEKDMTRLRQEKIGFVFQFHFLLPEFSALDNVAMPAILAGQTRENARARARELLEQVGLSHRLSHQPGELSGGEQQRVSIARALINRPSLLLADEPTGNLDSKNTENVFELLQNLNRDNLAVVLVTHNLELARSTQRQLYMLDGQISAYTS